MIRICVRVVSDGFTSASHSPSVGSSLLKKFNPVFFSALDKEVQNSLDTRAQLLDRNFLCLIPKQSLVEDIKKSISKQYQSIFYDTSNSDDSCCFVVSRLYTDKGLEMGLRDTQLTCEDLFDDGQIIFAKLDCVRRNGIALKQRFVQKEQDEKKQTKKPVNETPLFETPKKRKEYPQSVNDTKPLPSTKRTKIELSDSEDSDSVASNTEDEREIISKPSKKAAKATKKKTEQKVEKKTKKPDTTKVTKKNTEKVDNSKEKESKQPEAKIEKKPTVKKTPETINIEESEEENEEESEEETEVMTAQQYQKFFIQTKMWLDKNLVDGVLPPEHHTSLRETFKHLSEEHQEEILQYLRSKKEE